VDGYAKEIEILHNVYVPQVPTDMRPG